MTATLPPLPPLRPRDITLAVKLGVRPFVAPPCARCGRSLTDRDGSPRWEIVGKLTFVCSGGCPPPPRRPKGGLS